MQRSADDPGCVQKFKPVFESALYKTNVDVVGKHISGLLLFKRMPDSSIRLVFSNEIGYKFFDFEFSKDSGFRVFSIVDQMNKKAVIKTLRKDFELVLMMNIDSEKNYKLKSGEYFYHAFPQESGAYYYITDSACSSLVTMQRASSRKVVVEAIMKDYRAGMPDTIGITHHNFDFTIGLKRLK